MRLADLLEPTRAATVDALLRAVAGAIEAGAQVETEPVERDGRGAVRRSGPLDLPGRGDLTVTREGRSLPQRVRAAAPEGFPGGIPAPVSLVMDGGVTLVIEPFAWDDAVVTVEARQAAPDWKPLRLWFLDWMQGRQTDVSPELSGAVHALTGPMPAGPSGVPTGVWRIGLDFGSAPTAALAGLVEALAVSGAARIRLRPADLP